MYNRIKGLLYKKIGYICYLLLWNYWLFLPLFSPVVSGKDLPGVYSTQGILTREKEQAIGQAWLRDMRDKLVLLQDVLLQDYLLNLTYDLSVASGLSDYAYQLLLIDDKRINAFAVPGGIIGINTGLLIHADSLDQFVSVLAHELAHLKQKHFLRNIEYLQSTQNQDLAALLLGLGLFISGNSDAALATLYGNVGIKQNQLLAYSRDFETEADLLALQAMQVSGYDQSATIELLGKLQRDADKSFVVPEFLSTHPVTRNRIANLQERLLNNASQFKQTDVVERLNYDLLRSRLMIANKLVQTDFKSPEVERYYRALMTKNPQEAISLMHSLLSTKPDNLIYVVSLAEQLLADKQFKQAEALLLRHQVLNPQNYPINFYLALAYQQQNKLALAQTLFTSLAESRPESVLLWEKLAEVSRNTGALFAFHMAEAKIFVLRGKLHSALKHLDLASKNASSVIEKAQVKEAMQRYNALKNKAKNTL